MATWSPFRSFPKKQLNVLPTVILQRYALYRWELTLRLLCTILVGLILIRRDLIYNNSSSNIFHQICVIIHIWSYETGKSYYSLCVVIVVCVCWDARACTFMFIGESRFNVFLKIILIEVLMCYIRTFILN